MLKPDDNKPFPVRLGGRKAALQQQAAQDDRSLHYWILKIIDAHLKKTDKKNENVQPKL